MLSTSISKSSVPSFQFHRRILKQSRIPNVQVRTVEIKIFPSIAESRRFVSLLAILKFRCFSNQLCLQCLATSSRNVRAAFKTVM